MRQRVAVCVLLLALLIMSCDPTPDSSSTTEAPFPPPSSWSLVWADEFDDDGLPDDVEVNSVDCDPVARQLVALVGDS